MCCNIIEQKYTYCPLFIANQSFLKKEKNITRFILERNFQPDSTRKYS